MEQIAMLVETHHDGSQGIVYVQEMDFEGRPQLVLDKGEHDPNSIILSPRQVEAAILVMQRWLRDNA